MINIIFNKLGDIKSTLEEVLPELPDRRTLGQKLADTALELAYPEDVPDDVADYEGGLPKIEYWEALNKHFPHRRLMSRPYKTGGSCDLFIATVVRESGVDPNFPMKQGMTWSKGQRGYLEESYKWQRVKVNRRNIKDGDIIVYSKLPFPFMGHVCMHVGGKIVEVGYGEYYPKVVRKLSERLSHRGKGRIRVYRARNEF